MKYALVLIALSLTACDPPGRSQMSTEEKVFHACIDRFRSHELEASMIRECRQTAVELSKI